MKSFALNKGIPSMIPR